MKKCKQSQTDLISYLQGELTGKEKERFAQHLHQCAACREESLQLEKLGELVQKEAKTWQPSPLFWKQYNTELYRKLDERLKIPPTSFPWFGIALVFMFSLAIGLVLFEVFRLAVPPKEQTAAVSQEEILNDLAALEETGQSFNLEEVLSADETKDYLLAEYELLEQVGALPDDFINQSVSSPQTSP